MKIDITKTEKIAAALNEENGRAVSHTFTTKDLLDIRAKAEKHLTAHHVNKGERRHVTIHITSGEPLARSYKQRRMVNHATLEFSANGAKCYLTSLRKYKQWPNVIGGVCPSYTPELAEAMASRFAASACNL